MNRKLFEHLLYLIDNFNHLYVLFLCNLCKNAYRMKFNTYLISDFDCFVFSLLSLTCCQIPVLFTSSLILILAKGIFMMFPLAKEIWMFPGGPYPIVSFWSCRTNETIVWISILMRDHRDCDDIIIL